MFLVAFRYFTAFFRLLADRLVSCPTCSDCLADRFYFARGLELAKNSHQASQSINNSTAARPPENIVCCRWPQMNGQPTAVISTTTPSPIRNPRASRPSVWPSNHGSFGVTLRSRDNNQFPPFFLRLLAGRLASWLAQRARSLGEKRSSSPMRPWNARAPGACAS